MKNLDPKILQGIRDGKRAFKGPRFVQLDLTGRCNNECIGCWVHSPHVKTPPRDKNVVLPFEKVKKLVEELALLGAEEIQLSGAGEPFTHPQILEIIELIKGKGLKLNIITNFSLIGPEKAQKLIDLGVDTLTVSVWAGTGETYAKTHPGKTHEDFLRIKENLTHFSSLKTAQAKTLPRIKLYNVICSLNFTEIKEMVDLGIATGAEGIEFQIMDIIEGSTEFLALSSEQIKEIKNQFYELSQSEKLFFKELELLNFKTQQDLMEFPGRFIEVPKGFRIREWLGQDGSKKFAMHALTCPAGFSHTPTATNPLIETDRNRITFSIPLEYCRECEFFGKKCPATSEGKILLNYLVILGFGTFMRRLNSAFSKGNEYEASFIDGTPCYMGWEYARVLSTGEVIPCCKSVNNPLGDLHRENFSSIWDSRKYQEFRHHAKSFKKSHPYFNKINCLKFCDNVGMNLEIGDALAREAKKNKPLPPLARRLEEGLNMLAPRPKVKMVVFANKFSGSNLNAVEKKYGDGIVIDGGHGFAFAEYKVDFPEGGIYECFSCYASNEERPCEIHFDGKRIAEGVLNSVTGGWKKEDLRWFKEATLEVEPGKHTFKIYSKGLIPHLYAFAFLKGAQKAEDGGAITPGEKLLPEGSPLGLLKGKLKRSGLLGAAHSLWTYISGGKLFTNYLDILGIYTGDYAFKGPSHVQIDLTNDCNNDCIACWCNSPLLEEKTLSPKVKAWHLPLELVKKLLDELASMGTKEIYFSGGGEPFMHPHIMEILAYAKAKGFVCYVNTNFTLMTKEKLAKLIDLGVDHLTVSTWAATPQTYAATHPNKNERTFEEIRDNLKFLNMTKIRTPYIKLYNVISNRNFFELRDMISFAKETQSESVEFTLVDTMPGKTDKLLLDPVQSKALQNAASEIARELDRENRLDGVIVFGFHSFLRRISSPSDLAKATYDRNIIDRMPCSIGWTFARIMPNGDVNACLKAHRIPTGNIYGAGFREIWNGTLQKNFRKKTLVYEKKDPFFTQIGNDPDTKEAGCYKSCDDIGRNTFLHNRIMSLTLPEKLLLKFIAVVMKRNELKKNAVADPVVRGAIDGRKAFSGPEQVVIDVTNRCNQKCIACWLYSPSLKTPPAKDWLKQELDLSKAKALIDSFKKLKVKEVRFTGGGEPLMHPGIMDMIRRVKSHGIRCSLTTNFSLMTREKINELIRLGLDELTVSLWASNNAVYQKTHPGASADLFGKIDENLRYLAREKKNNLSVVLSHVVCKLNYEDIEAMFLYALDAGADGIYYTLVDTLEGTEGLLLDPEERKKALEKAECVRDRWEHLPGANRIRLDYFEGFLARLKGEGTLTGRYDEARIGNIPCYAGWSFARVLPNGDIAPCCRGVKKIMGNIKERPFEDIWFSDRYDEFRSKAKALPKTDPFFKEVGCLKECDNLMHNEELHRRIHGK